MKITQKIFISIFFVSLTYTNFSCSKKAYSVHRQNTATYKNTAKQSDSKKLKSFISEGTGKKLNVGTTKPDDIIKTARKYFGVPHCMGGSSKKCTDCSGLVMAVFAEHKVHFPHNSEEQARYGKIIRDKAQLRKGDLVFFINSYKTHKYITHVGIYLGKNEFIHTSSKKGVTVTSLDNSWWKDKFIFGTRVFNN
jgi:cell wall-associated NlpC family hydrolase